jgi:hypothetical protein
MPYETVATLEARRRIVLVAVMNNREDFRRAASEGWYRIPQRRAPRRIGADYLAFYQTGAFSGDPEAQTVTYYAPTRRYHLLTRREMMPDEADHPRADDYYFRIDIGPLQRLEQPVPSASMRRITFISTTLDRLYSATDVRDLFYQEDPFETLWHALREHRLRPLPNRIVAGEPVDITLRASGGYLGVQCRETNSAHEAPHLPLPDRWRLLHVAPSEIERDLNRCLRRIASGLISLGGSDLRIVNDQL